MTHTLFCNKCSISFLDEKDYCLHLFSFHVNTLNISTDFGSTAFFPKIEDGNFKCSACLNSCSSFYEILLHLFCEPNVGNNSDKKRYGNGNIRIDPTDATLHEGRNTLASTYQFSPSDKRKPRPKTERKRSEYYGAYLTEQLTDFDVFSIPPENSNNQVDSLFSCLIENHGSSSSHKHESLDENFSLLQNCGNSPLVDNSNNVDSNFVEKIAASINSSSRPKKPKPLVKKPSPVAAVLSDLDHQVLDVIRQMYPDEDPMYYLRLVKKLPVTFDEPLVSWPSIHRNFVRSKIKNTGKWKDFGKKLAELGLIVIDTNLKAKRVIDEPVVDYTSSVNLLFSSKRQNKCNDSSNTSKLVESGSSFIPSSQEFLFISPHLDGFSELSNEHNRSEFIVPEFSSPSRPKKAKILVQRPAITAVLSEQDHNVLDIIRQIYTNEDPMFYLKVVRKFPISFEEPFVTWSQIHKNHVSSKRKDSVKWQELGRRLCEAELVEIVPKLKAKRNFI